MPPETPDILSLCHGFIGKLRELWRLFGWCKSLMSDWEFLGIFGVQIFQAEYIVSYVCDTLDVFPDVLLFRSAICSRNATLV